MKNHLLSIALIGALGLLPMAPTYAQEARTADNATLTISAVELNAGNTYQDLPKIAVHSDLTTHRFSLLLPKGASLHPVPEEVGQQFLSSDVLVKDARGAVIGSIDSAWAQDAKGASLATFFSIEGQTLVQTIDTADVADKTVIAVLMYNGRDAQFHADASPGVSLLKAYVGIPSNYVYNLNHPRKSLHDYCTKSPDEFPNPFGGNANFRGPCARHDMCFENRTYSQYTCNNRLRSDMRSNCADKYAWYNPTRGVCYDTANVYWVAVTANTIWPW